MGPFNVLELPADEPMLLELWTRGGFPGSYLAPNDTESLRWRGDFIRTYLERDVPQFGPRVPAGVLERLWTMLAHGQGTLLNASRLASALQITAPTVQRYIDLLADLLLVRRLQPFHSNAGKRLVKSPKVYIRDSGLVHALLGLRTFNDLAGHPVAGSSWEGYVIENLLAAAPERTVASFYRTAAGAEIDLLLEIPGHGLWAIEVKRSLSGRPEKGFYIACQDLKPDRRFVVNAGLEQYPIDAETIAIGVPALARMLSALTI
jgi:hypothetical protein